MISPARFTPAPDAAAAAVPPPAIRATSIVKEFGFRRVVDDVSLDIQPGTFLTMFGPNGAGKTTLIRILASVCRPTSGRVEVDGRDLRGRDQADLRSRIGVISHQTFLYDGLTGMENLLFFAGLYGIERPRERARELLQAFQLWERRYDRVGTYSRGMQQRLAIARALIHHPRILLLDEPFTGLDPVAARLLVSLLERLKEDGRVVVMTTHDLTSGLSLSDRWIILAGGRMVDEGVSRETDPGRLESRYFEAVRA